MLVMELAQGGSLDRIIAAAGTDTAHPPLTSDFAIRIASDIALALCFVHNLGRRHGDVKPQNIVLTTRGEAKLCDFGLAKMVMENLPQTDTRMGKAGE